MKLDGLFEHEFQKLKLKKVKLYTDPKKPLLPYEGYILGENSKFGKIYENIFRRMGKNIVKGVRAVGRGYNKLQRTSDSLKRFGQGDIGLLSNFGSNFTTTAGLTERQIASIGVSPYEISALKSARVRYVTKTDSAGNVYVIRYRNGRFFVRNTR
jgi:hypothetical protein